MMLSDLTWMEIRDLIPQNPVIIQPVGSTEQHGPHLPVQVDISSAFEVAKAVGDRTGCLVAPPLPYGYSEVWENFPGTISFTVDTFMACVAEITESLVRNGFKRIFFLNGHNPNLPLLQTMMFKLMDRYGRDGDKLIVAGSYFMVDKETCDAIGDNFREGTHANEFETAFMMHIRPDMVHVDQPGRLGVQARTGALLPARGDIGRAPARQPGAQRRLRRPAPGHAGEGPPVFRGLREQGGRDRRELQPGLLRDSGGLHVDPGPAKRKKPSIHSRIHPVWDVRFSRAGDGALGAGRIAELDNIP